MLVWEPSLTGPKSLPSRERGLKLAMPLKQEWKLSSLPSRERGLKSSQIGMEMLYLKSLPSRERGLK